MVPWLIGAVIGFFFGHRISAGKAQIVLLALTGGTLGIFSIAPLTLYFESAALLLLDLSVFLDFAVYLLASVIVLATCVILFRSRSLNFVLITLCLFMLIVFSIYNIALLPISSWDFHGFWGLRAQGLIEHIAIGTGDSFQYDHPHPITLVIISAWGWHGERSRRESRSPGIYLGTSGVQYFGRSFYLREVARLLAFFCKLLLLVATDNATV